jgi:hypothetical protein
MGDSPYAMKTTLRGLLFVSLSLFSLALRAAESGTPPLDSEMDGAAQTAPLNDTSAALRGYGKIHLTTSQEKGCTVWKFEATSAANAETTTGKFLADLNLSPGVTTGTLEINGATFPTTTVPGGAVYTGFVSGQEGHVISAPDEATLKSFLTGMPSTGIPVTNLKYPPYLDRFDRHGWGFYGFNGNFGALAPSPNEGSTDPDADMDWIQKYHLRFELWPNPGDFDDNWSVSERHTHGWLLNEAEKRDVPVSARLYGALPHVKQFTDLRDVEAPFMEGGWYWAILGYRDYPRQSWFSKPGRLYMARQARDEVNMYADHPEIESWMMPYGEVGTYDWYTYHGDVSKSAQDDWRDTIQNKLHLSLAKLSSMYGRKDHPFTSYADVSMPEVATFDGLPGEIQDLEGEWSVKVESTPGEGAAAQWWNADVKDWDHLHMPGSVYWFKYSKYTTYLPKWVIRDFDYDSAKAAGQTVYLYDYARAVNNQATQTGLVYLNGEKVGEPASWGVWDVTKLLKPGTNRLALQTDTFGGRVFLSTDKPALYPYLGADRNELWIDFNQWLENGRYAASDEALAGIRMAEPNKPIKIMAPLLESSDQWLDMASKYGAWGHFTGEGMWAFFWYKRYGFLYGLPGTSEGAGPGNLQGLVDLYQRVLLEGLNGHDQVFDVQFITGLPDEKKFFEDHMAVIKQMGRYDIAGPQVVVYRSTNQATRLMPAPMPLQLTGYHEIQSVWNWDFARGVFQSDGYSGIYVDDGGIASGKIAHYPLMMDCGNEILTPAAIKNLGDWIRNGGTYVTLPFTGRSEPSAPDSWPISAITGCTVTKLRTPGPGTGTVTIGQDQTILKGLAGKSFPDDGSDKEGNGFEHNFLSTELKPGPDCQVIAKYEDGTAAIVVHTLGKGRVVVLGSTFFNHIQDKKGIWLPDQQDSDFFRDLFTGLGFSSPNWTTDRLVLTQRYRTNNGLDDAVVLDNFAGADRTVDLHVVVDQKPEKVYRVAMNEVTEVPFTMDGNTVTVAQQAIPKEEVQMYYFRSHPPENAVAHWWNYQKKLWKPLSPEKLDFSSISHGRFVDQAVDMKDGWQWAQDDAAATAVNQGHMPSRHATTKPWLLDIYNTKGADPTKPVYAWKTFEATPAWLKDGGITKLVAAAADGDFSTGKREFHLNGQLLQKDGFFNPDVTSLLKSGTNVLTVRLDPSTQSHYIGALGALYLTHAKLPVKTIDLSGTWFANPPGIGDARNSAGPTVQFPGKASAFLPTRTVDIPADWKDKYIVTYYAVGARGSSIGAIVNETGVIRRHDHIYGDETEVDITPFLQFGKTNTIAMLSTGGQSLDATHDWDVSKVELRLYPRSENR